MGYYLKQLMIRKMKNPMMNLPHLPFTSKPRKRHRKQEMEFRNKPSIYIPHEMKTQDTSSMFNSSEQIKSRQEEAFQEKLKQDVILIIIQLII